RGPPGGQTLVDLGNPLRTLPLLDECPSPQDRPHGRVERKPMLRTDRHCLFCPFLGCWPLAAELTHEGGKRISQSQAKGVREFLRQGRCLMASLQCLVRIARKPQNADHVAQTKHPRVLAIKESEGTMLLHIIPGDPLLQVLSGEG